MSAFSGHVGEGFFNLKLAQGETKMLELGFIGAGTVGTAQSVGLNDRGYQGSPPAIISTAGIVDEAYRE